MIRSGVRQYRAAFMPRSQRKNSFMSSRFAFLRSACMAMALAGTLAVSGGAFAQGRPPAKEEVLPLAGTEKLTPADLKEAPVINVPVEAENVWDLDLSTGGRVRIQLRPDIAPAHVARIKELTRQGFYNGLIFHRVIEGFMAQGGDPKGDGTGGSSLPDLKAEFNALPHLRGTVSMARSQEPDSANSQFFILFLPRMQLDKNYTVFGRVIGGMQYVDSIPLGEPPAAPARIVQASIESDGKGPPAPGAAPAMVLPSSLPPTPSAADLNAPMPGPQQPQ